MNNQTSTSVLTPETPRVFTKKESLCNLAKRIAIVLVAFGIILAIIPEPWGFIFFISSTLGLTLATGIKITQIIHPGKLQLLSTWNTLANSYEKLDRRLQLYLNIIICLPFLFYCYLLDANDLFPSVAILVFSYSLGIAAYDIYCIYAALYTTSIGKGLLAITFAIGSNFAFIFSGKIIGEMTHVPPITFPHTLSFLAIFAIPFLFMAAGVIFIPFSIVMGPFFIYGSSFAAKAPRFIKWFFGVEYRGPGSRQVIAMVIFQVIFYPAIGTLAHATLLALLNQYSQQIDSAIGHSIYEFDMYPGTECKVTTEHRQASLGDENYILASKTTAGITFDPPKKCAL